MKLVAAETVKLSTETRLNPTLTGTLPAADWHVKRIAGLLCRIYLLELVHYLRLNPLRAQVVTDLRALNHFPWTGHSALLGIVPRPWQATGAILAQFGLTSTRARRACCAFIAAGIAQGDGPEFGGGPLISQVVSAPTCP